MQENSNGATSSSLLAKTKESSKSGSPGNEEGSEVQGSDDETSEPGEANGREEEAAGGKQNGYRVRNNGMRTKKVNTKDWLLDEQVDASDDLVRDSRRRIERERDLDGRTEGNQIMATAQYATRNRVQSPMNTFGSDQHVELSPESSTVGSAGSTNLKVVYDVEYQAPY